MQVREEFRQLLGVINSLPRRRRHAALQLGMGPCRASHDVWRLMFDRVVTLDLAGMAIDQLTVPGRFNTHNGESIRAADARAPYDLLFIDAGHSEVDVAKDFIDYEWLVPPGGLIVFHDALPRAGYPEVGVWKFLATLPNVNMIGDEVGTAWIKK